ncbi:MarR family transcriptional regulator [Halocatena pleomorpha]|uniref:MarR family transcriptional regulator n=1 Tax=Halocatena pleomorpha TaxID=1785090 RepID=A0A3P3RDI3_9EURY|nr:MarR family transcriptional regulator [Halocatena pleomorpha]
MDHTTETDNAFEILVTLDERGPCRVTEVAKVLNVHPVPVDRTCTRLQQEGLLQRQHGGTYRVTETGRVAIENHP